MVGWAVASHLKTDLVLAALNMALAKRRPGDVVHYSDHVCQYTAPASGNLCRRMGLFQYIEGWYNPHRRHSGIGNQSPIRFEAQQATAA